MDNFKTFEKMLNEAFAPEEQMLEIYHTVFKTEISKMCQNVII